MSKELEDLINKYNISVCDTDAILRFSSSKANNMYDIYKTFRCSLRGVRIKEFRPDIVELVWVGKDFDFNNLKLKSPVDFDDLDSDFYDEEVY